MPWQVEKEYRRDENTLYFRTLGSKKEAHKLGSQPRLSGEDADFLLGSQGRRKMWAEAAGICLPWPGEACSKRPKPKRKDNTADGQKGHREATSFNLLEVARRKAQGHTCPSFWCKWANSFLFFRRRGEGSLKYFELDFCHLQPDYRLTEPCMYVKQEWSP